jgi:hypothetical protein
LKRTVFVLGAGASKPFGLPTGQELFEAVITVLEPQNSGFAALRALEFPVDAIAQFRLELSRSGRASVDAFLEHRPDHMKIGKAAMSHVLVGREDPNRLFRHQGEWLGYLYQRLPNPFRELPAEMVSFLTFNYDRSVEHFLFCALHDGFGADEKTCVKALEKIPIIHLHGSLGPLPWQDSASSRAYVANPDPHALTIATKGIKIVHEDIADGRDNDFESAKWLLKQAKQIYFLGFGYAKTNMLRLDVPLLEKGVSLGTGLGLTAREAGDIETVINNRIRVLPQYDCLSFLRNEVNWN